MIEKDHSFSHLDEKGSPGMVDISGKAYTLRKATARSIVVLGENILKLLDGNEIHSPKGPVFQTAILAGTMAVKRTWDLIPLCHPLALDKISIEIKVRSSIEVSIECTVVCTGKTGVEMEALTGASLAALTLYDMCKAVSHDIVIRDTRLLEKTGGKSAFRHE